LAQKVLEERSRQRILMVNQLVNTGRFEEAYWLALEVQADQVAAGFVVPPALLEVLKKRAGVEPPRLPASRRAVTEVRIQAINELMNAGRLADAYGKALDLQSDQIARGIVLSPAMLATLKQLAEEELATKLVTLHINKRTLTDVLHDVSQTSGIRIVIDSRVADRSARLLTVNLRSIKPETAVRLLVNMTDLEVVRVDQVFYVTSKENARSLRQDSRDGHSTP
jgi:hypothetical protein